MLQNDQIQMELRRINEVFNAKNELFKLSEHKAIAEFYSQLESLASPENQLDSLK